jgi:hypothetical protein
MPRQILAARPLLERLARDVRDMLGPKPALFVRGMKDFVFKPKRILPRMQATFLDNLTVELPHARHYIQEDTPGNRAGGRQPLRLTPLRQSPWWSGPGCASAHGSAQPYALTGAMRYVGTTERLICWWNRPREADRPLS